MQKKTFKELVEETQLQIRASKIVSAYSNTTRSEIMEILNSYLEIIENEEYLPAMEIKILYAATGCICETAIDNGWSDKHFEIANQVNEMIS